MRGPIYPIFFKLAVVSPRRIVKDKAIPELLLSVILQSSAILSIISLSFLLFLSSPFERPFFLVHSIIFNSTISTIRTHYVDVACPSLIRILELCSISRCGSHFYAALFGLDYSPYLEDVQNQNMVLHQFYTRWTLYVQFLKPNVG